MDRFWVPHEEHAFVNCHIIGEDGENTQFMSDMGEQITVKKALAHSMQRVSDDQLSGIDNVCNLSEVNEAAVLNTCKVRYARKEIYTRVARILIAVNPFQTMNIYSGAYVEKYTKAVDSMDMDPHVYGVGLDAVNGSRRSGKNQAVLISGESGAGKTETTKLVLTYVSSAVPGVEGIEDKILQTNPVLEAFGNAMTVRNNNSSRFGKWLEMSISKTFTILGCSITDFLLELTRVTSQGSSERCFHVFFQVLRGVADEVSHLDRKKPDEYLFLQGSCYDAPKIDDVEEFAAMNDAFLTLGMGDKRKDIYSVVIGILTLGNAEFKEKGDASEIANDAPVASAAKMLGVDVAKLKDPLLNKTLVVGKERTLQPLKASAAKSSRDALVRLIYGKLFKWLIKNINKTLVGETSNQFFGVLDVAGFESFAVNSLEQLFINLGNEYLQGHFNNHVFKMELEDYVKEGVDVGAIIEFKDNDGIIALIAGKDGLMPILDNEISVPKATDQTYVNKTTKQHEKHPNFIKDKFGKCMYSVQHFAGPVVYTCDNFLEKNTDNPPKEAADLMMSSSNMVLKEVGEALAIEQAEAEKSRAKKTVSKSFRASLDELMTKLRSAEPHFVRCVKPNSEKVPDKFTAPLVREQLVLSGVMEAVRIRQQGYASRIPHAEFCSRYRCVLQKKKQRAVFVAGWKDKPKETAANFIKELPEALEVCGKVPVEHFLVGNNKVLAKVTAMGVMDQAYDMAVSGNAVDIQRLWKGGKVRKMMKEVKVAVKELKDWQAKYPVYKAAGPEHTAVAVLKTCDAIDASAKVLQELMDRSDGLPVKLPNAETHKKNIKRMENESKLIAQIGSVKLSVEPIELDKVLARAKDLEFPESMTDPIKNRRQKLKEQIPIKGAMEAALGQDSITTLQEVWDEAVKQQLVGESKVAGKWVPELQGEELSTKLKAKLDDLIAKQTAEMKRKEEEENRKRKEEEERMAAEAAAKNVTPKKMTITGMNMEDQTRLVLGIKAAIHEYDVVMLESRLGEAAKQGMEPEDLEDGSDFLNNLNKEEFLADKMQELTAKFQGDQPDAHQLKCMQNLIKQATALGVCQEEVAEAKAAQQQGMRKRGSLMPGANVFASGNDSEDAELADGIFSSIAEFRNLKPAAQWRGHVSEGLFTRGAKGSEVMLSHSKAEIKESLTKIPTAAETKAVKNYKNILGWCHDKPVPEVQRLGFSQDIVDFAMSSPELGDEVYVQLIKQLTNNPSKRSALGAWKLVALLCQQALPTAELIDFVRAFIRNATRNKDPDMEEIVSMAKQSLKDLDELAQEGAEEQEEDTIAVQVQLIDGCCRKVHVKSGVTLEKLGETMAEQMGIFKFEAFSFFQLTEGLETHRLLPGHTVLTKLLDKWQQLKGVTGRTSKLLWKRRFMRVDEKLNPGDLQHATLTYRQALWDYFRYPIHEDFGFLCKIAATILCIERDHYAQVIMDNKLADANVLEHLLPEYILKQRKRAQWAEDILKKYQQLETRLDPNETRLQKMSRIVSLTQKMKLFGAYYWLGRQVYSVSADKVSIPDAPEENCKVNPKQQEDEYWVVVDVFGVRFVAPSAVAGKQFQRGFLFHDEAMERIIRWGAKQNVVEFVVQTVNPQQPKSGRVPMSVRVASTGAVDIAYAIHCIQNERKGVKW